MTCPVCGGTEFVSIVGEQARTAFPSGRRCARFFSHGLATYTLPPLVECPQYNRGYRCRLLAGHEGEHMTERVETVSW